MDGDGRSVIHSNAFLRRFPCLGCNHMHSISVVTVVFNNPHGLRATIDSVRAQTVDDFEFVIVDGGSTDDTLAVIHDDESHIDQWISEPDRGIYDAMNKGVQLATGRYVLFLNAGDTFYDPSVVGRFISEMDPESDVIYADCFVEGSYRSDGHRPARSIDQIHRGMICSHQSMLAKRAVLCMEPFRSDLGTAGDFELLCRMYAKSYRFQQIHSFVVSRYAAGGVSDQKRLQSVSNCMKALQMNGLMRPWDRLYWGCMYVYQAVLHIVRVRSTPT